MQIQNFITEQIFIGMNDRYPAHLLPSGVYQLIDNALVDGQRLAKRKGTDPTAAALGGLSQDILGLGAYQPISGTRYQVGVVNGAANGRAYYWTGTGSWTALAAANLTKDAPVNMVQASNLIYGFNGHEVFSVDSALIYTLNPATVPIGKFGVWFHNYLFVAGDPAAPSRLYWSDLGDPTTFTGTSFFDVNPNDGDEITGMYIFNDELYVFKKNTIWSITGFSGSTFTATTVAGQNLNSKIYGYGTPSHRSIVSTGRDLFWISYGGGIPHFRALRQTQYATTLDQGIMSYDIEVTMNALNKTSLSLVAGIYDGKYVRWALPNGGSDHNNITLVFDPATSVSGKTGIKYRSWVKWTGFSASCFIASDISGLSRIYFGDGGKTGFVHEADVSDFADNGTPVVMTVQSRDMRLDLAKKAKFIYLYTNQKSGLSGDLDINARVDGSIDYTNQNIIDLSGTSPGLGTFIMGTSTLGGATTFETRTVLQHLTGHLLGIQFMESTESDCEIYDYRVYATPKGLRAS